MVAIRREHLDPLPLDSHDRDVERSAAEVENEDRLIFIELVEAVGHGRRGRLVDDLQDVEPGELAGGDRGRPLGIIEIGRNGNHRVRHRLLQIFFRVGFQLAQDEGGKFLGGINLPVELPMKLLLRLAHLALHEIDNPFRFGHGIVLREGADDHARAIEKNDRRRDTFAFGVWDDLRLSVGIDVRDSAKRGAEVDSNCFSSGHICGLSER